MKAAWLALVLALCACSSSQGGGQGKGGPKKALAFPVEVAPVESRSVEYTLSAVGSVEAFETVQVTARVAGAVDRVRFVEGQSVKPGDVLVEIDPTRYSLAVRAAKATLDRALAGKADAEASLKRREGAQAASPGLITDEELALYRTKVATAAAEADSAQVALERAQVDLRDAYVKAPVGGVLQTRTVQTGQYVQPGAILATLVRRDPVLVRFKVPEVDASHVDPGLPFSFLAGGEAKPLKGHVTLVAVAADPSSRMVAVTGEADEADRERARPGAFADVTVPVGDRRDAPVVPQTAVRPSEKGFLAYVVDGEVARERVLSLGLRTADGLIEVRSGLKPGETLVVRGAEALRDGAPVQRIEAALPAPVKADAAPAPGGRP
ncbi:MAG: efflux RND transporter periplasmic adaptor subunit [Myxococcales bacterium]|nr:efflux RND transporter periplasmic adaptor subunit [Myxococcales bacterium]